MKRMFDKKGKNIEVFRDTTVMIEESGKLKEAVKNSIINEKLYPEDKEVEEPSKQRQEKTDILVSGKRSFEAAANYAREGKKVCVLNFASATNPGGGVVNGSSAQEEALCRCSTLYPCLNERKIWGGFYLPHRKANDPLYNDDCVYTPGIVVCKSDTDSPERLKKEDWYTVDVLTCAAPNLRAVPSNRMNPDAGSHAAEISEEALLALHEKRIRRIFAIAAKEGAEVLILGAFGCGAFCNPPEIVAQAFRKVQEEFQGCFETIEYAVFCRNYESKNYKVFHNVMDSAE